MASSTGSNADEVGSAPEDQLAAAEAEPVAEPGTEERAKTEESTGPFADLSQAEKSEPSAPVAESLTNTDATIESNPDSSGAPSEMQTYTVKSGDTLMKIAFSIYGDLDKWKDLKEWNQGKLKNANALKSGMALKYQAPSAGFQVEALGHTYLIKKGDTLATIADEVYGRKMKFKKLQKFNSHLIKNPNRIFAGFTLYYDITEKELAEAEARRQQRLAESNKPQEPANPNPAPASNDAPPAPQQAEAVPSAITGPGVETPAPPPVATAPSPAPAPAPAPAPSASPPAAGIQ